MADALGERTNSPRLSNTAEPLVREHVRIEDNSSRAATVDASSSSSCRMLRRRFSTQAHRSESGLTCMARWRQPHRGSHGFGVEPDGNWTFVDFKTDEELTRFSNYAMQVGLYGKAMQAATGQATSVVLMRI